MGVGEKFIYRDFCNELLGYARGALGVGFLLTN